MQYIKELICKLWFHDFPPLSDKEYYVKWRKNTCKRCGKKIEYYWWEYE